MRAWKSLALCFLVLSIATMLLAFKKLPSLEGRSVSTAFVDTRDTRLGRTVVPLAQVHPQQSGVLALTDGREVFAARALLARAAERSIDAQYYLWRRDFTGMDALPVGEPQGLPFASQETAKYYGKMVPVMHACGHDAHTAMLMATAQILAGLKDELPGTVMFIFQPAEEGSSVVAPSTGKSWGAKLMLEEGLFKDIKPDAVFALHVMPGHLEEISYRSGATTASSDTLEMTVTGKQGHGGMPWNTVDPIATSALIISGLQTVVSRKANLTASPVVVTIGSINGGTAPNVVPETVQMAGTIRTYDEKVRQQVHGDIRLVAEKIAESAGAKAEVTISKMYDTTVNDEALTARMAPVLKRGEDGQVAKASMAGASEDFSFFAKAIPGLYVFLGVTPRHQDPATAAPNHNPKFFVDEAALIVGARTMASLTVNFLTTEPE